MALGSGGELDVDVLVVGGGIQGLYVAAALAPKYRVCVVSDPDLAPETLDSTGLISAGYDGNDPNRIQPARRAAGYWRMWAEMAKVPHRSGTAVFLVPPEEAVSRPRMWDDAMLSYHPADELPGIFAGGALADGVAYRLDDDVVINPAVLLDTLRVDLNDCLLEGRVVRCDLVADEYVDHVEVEVGDQTITVVPRYIVLAAGVGNADLLGMAAKRFGDVARRRDAQETARTSQAVQLATVVCVKGVDLPEVSGWFGDLSIVSQPATDADEIVWLVSLPPNDEQTTLGPQDLRFGPPSDRDAVEAVLQRLMAVVPGLDGIRTMLKWATYTARRTQHPSLAIADSSAVARPVPAKIESLGLDALVALWPSHLGYSMVLGDVIAERVTAALGEPGDFSDGLRVSDIAFTTRPLRSRWERSDTEWLDWEVFSGR